MGPLPLLLLFLSPSVLLSPLLPCLPSRVRDPGGKPFATCLPSSVPPLFLFVPSDVEGVDRLRLHGHRMQTPASSQHHVSLGTRSTPSPLDISPRLCSGSVAPHGLLRVFERPCNRAGNHPVVTPPLSFEADIRGLACRSPVDDAHLPEFIKPGAAEDRLPLAQDNSPKGAAPLFRPPLPRVP